MTVINQNFLYLLCICGTPIIRTSKLNRLIRKVLRCNMLAESMEIYVKYNNVFNLSVGAFYELHMLPSNCICVVYIFSDAFRLCIDEEAGGKAGSFRPLPPPWQASRRIWAMLVSEFRFAIIRGSILMKDATLRNVCDTFIGLFLKVFSSIMKWWWLQRITY